VSRGGWWGGRDPHWPSPDKLGDRSSGSQGLERRSAGNGELGAEASTGAQKAPETVQNIESATPLARRQLLTSSILSTRAQSPAARRS